VAQAAAEAEAAAVDPTATQHEVYEDAVPPLAVADDTPAVDAEAEAARRAEAFQQVSDIDLAHMLNSSGTVYNEALQVMKEGREQMRFMVLEAARRGVSTMTLHRLTALSRPTIEAWRTEAGYPSRSARTVQYESVLSEVSGTQEG
jgi:hypothetical protein